MLFFYHIFFFLLIFSYWQTVMTSPGKVPKKYRLTQEELESIEQADTELLAKQTLETLAINKDLAVQTRTITGALRYCEKCSHIKPDRCHHCSVCNSCVLKMDHHCPWVNNCINFTNYKFFVLFLGYAFIYCLYISLSTIHYFIMFWRNELNASGKFHVLFLFLVAIMFSISLASLFGYHIFLVTQNRTTLESFRAPTFVEGPDKMGFSLGAVGNFYEVFGDSKWRWFLPVESSFGDGLVFPRCAQSDEEFGLLSAEEVNWEDCQKVTLLPHDKYPSNSDSDEFEGIAIS